MLGEPSLAMAQHGSFSRGVSSPTRSPNLNTKRIRPESLCVLHCRRLDCRRGAQSKLLSDDTLASNLENGIFSANYNPTLIARHGYAKTSSTQALDPPFSQPSQPNQPASTPHPQIPKDSRPGGLDSPNTTSCSLSQRPASSGAKRIAGEGVSSFRSKRSSRFFALMSVSWRVPSDLSIK